MGGQISTPPYIPPPRAMIKTGTYTGDGLEDRNVDIGIDLASKSNAYVIIKGNVAYGACHRIEYAQGNLSMLYSTAVDVTFGIKAFTSTGFLLGTRSEVNQNTIVYRYIAFWQEG